MKGFAVGFHFQPSDEEAITYYLKKRVGVGGQHIKYDYISELDLYSGDPWEVLSENHPWDTVTSRTCDKRGNSKTKIERTLYLFTALKRSSKKKINRTAGSGTWDQSYRDEIFDIGNEGKQLIGFKRTFSFSIKNRSDKEYGSWIMNEYSLPDDTENIVFCKIKIDGTTHLRGSESEINFEKKRKLIDEEEEDSLSKKRKMIPIATNTVMTYENPSVEDDESMSWPTRAVSDVDDALSDFLTEINNAITLESEAMTPVSAPEPNFDLVTILTDTPTAAVMEHSMFDDDDPFWKLPKLDGADDFTPESQLNVNDASTTTDTSAATVLEYPMFDNDDDPLWEFSKMDGDDDFYFQDVDIAEIISYLSS